MRDIMPYIWLIIAIIFGAAEALTYQLVAIWFAFGAVAAMIVSYFGTPIWVEIAVFIAVSSAVLYFLRPFAAKHLQSRRIRTNVNGLIGMVGLVTEDIDNVRSTGRITVNNSDWAARSDDGTPIAAGEQVLVKSVAGVKLMVEPVI